MQLQRFSLSGLSHSVYELNRRRLFLKKIKIGKGFFFKISPQALASCLGRH